MAYSSTGEDVIERRGIAAPLTAALRRVSWGAILVGIVVSLATQVLLAMLGAGIGTAVIEPVQQGANPATSSIGIGAAIWWAISGVIAAFAGGWVASRLAGSPSREVGMLHGLGAWAATTLLVLYLLGSTATAMVGGAFSMVTQTISGIGNAAGSAASSIGQMANPLQAIQDEVRAAANPNDPQAAGRQIATAVGRMVQQGMTEQQAEQRIAQWEQTYQQTRDQAEQQARSAADAAADSTSAAAFYAFIALLIGAIAGALGGRIGTPKVEALIEEAAPSSGRVRVS
jgi:hypothetical protein